METYRAIIIQDIGDNEAPFSFAGTNESGETIEDEFDHGLNHKAIGTGINIFRATPQDKAFSVRAYYKEINMEMTVTDCRVIYRCDHYDKGATWSGGLTALAMNGIEKAIAKKRTAGKVLLGHIRYEWIREILYIAKEKKGLFDSPEYSIRIVYMDNTETLYMIEVVFAKGTDTRFIANEILHKACIYRLAMNDEKPENLVSFCQKYSIENIPFSGDPKSFSRIKFPQYYLAPGGKAKRPTSL